MKILISRLIFSGLSCIIGIFFVVASWEAYSEYERVKDYTGVAAGYVTRKHYQRASDGNTLYYLDYWFSVAGGRQIKTTRNVVKEHWDSLKINDPLEVRYDQLNPDRNIPLHNGNISLVYAVFVFVLGSVFMLFGIMRIIKDIRDRFDKAQ